MLPDRLRTHILTLPHAVEWTQWGDLIYSVGDIAIGGKMFAMVTVPLPTATRPPELVISFPAGPERYHQLLELEGIRPAPYFARIHWVAVERWDALTTQQWQEELTFAHALTTAKLPPKTRKILALPRTQQKQAILEARKLRTQKEKQKRADKL